MARVLKFVVLSIRESLHNLPEFLWELEQAEQGQASPAIDSILFGFKGQAVHQVEQEKELIYDQAMDIAGRAENRRECELGLLALYASIHGVGLVKAGFASQLCFGVSGCIDTHNVNRFELDARKLKSSRYKVLRRASTRTKRLTWYCDLVDKLGGTEALWDDWCHYVADKNTARYEDAFAVSKVHCDAILQ
jgi:hypothetical protein